MQAQHNQQTLKVWQISEEPLSPDDAWVQAGFNNKKTRLGQDANGDAFAR